MPTVSIIMPTYNREHVLGRAIQSVLAQSYQDFELIIVDDGSTDNTDSLVKSFDSEMIRYIRLGENKGPAVARNTGIKSAKGDYIAFQDSDDEWMPEKLEKQTRAFETAPPEVGIVYTGFYIIRNNRKRVVPHGGLPAKDGNVFFSLLKGYFVLPSATVIKRECFARAGIFDERLFPSEDSELFLRMSMHYQFKCINEPLIIYHLQPDSISKNRGARIKPNKLILETYFEYIKQDKRALAYHYSRLGNLLCSSGELTQGRDYFANSIKARPLDIRYIIAFLVSLLGRRTYNIVVKSYRKIVKPF